MDRKDYEFSAPPGEEFSAPRPGAEFNPPAPETEFSPPRPEAEFSPVGTQSDSPPRRSRKRKLRYLAFAAAALVYIGLLFGGAKQQEPPLPAETVVPAPPEPIAPAVVTPEPAEGTETAPVDEPEPESVELDCELVFFKFSAEHLGFVKLINQEQVRSAVVEIWEPVLDTLEWSHELTEEELAMGYYELPAFDESETYFKHLDDYQEKNIYPSVELRAILVVDGEDGEETLRYTQAASYEQGWAVRYWPDDYVPTWDFENAYPGYFALNTYESFNKVPQVAMGSYETAEEGSGIYVSLELNGVPVSEEDYEVVIREEEGYSYDENGEVVPDGSYYYYATLLIRRPDDAPLSGTARFTVYQKLEGYDIVWTTIKEIAY